MTTKTKTCRDCGAAFAASRTDYTVRCPACRRGAAPTRGASCTVCEGIGWFTIGPGAVDGKMTDVTCHRCGGTGVVR